MTGSGLADAILVILGNIFVIILAGRGIQLWAKKEWGEMIGFLAGAVVVAAFIWLPDQMISLLQWFWNLFAGS